jgi:uncharacterized protein (TIGR00369 family)
MKLVRYADPIKMMHAFKRVSSDKKAFSIDIVRALELSEYEPIKRLASPDDLVFELKAPQSTGNYLGLVHGGAICTITDVCNSFQLVMHDRLQRKQVTTNLNTNFIRSAKVGDMIYLITKTDKIGKTIGFASAQFYNAGGDVLYKASTTMMLIDEKWTFD